MFFPTTLLGSFELGRRALTAHQTALDTIGHNLANAATPGYSRQRVELSPLGPRQGVEVTTIRRIRDRFLDFALLAEEQEAGRLQARQALLQRLEAAINDPPGTGLSAVLDQFFQAFQELSVRPSDQAVRILVRDGGERLAASFRELRARLDQIAVDLEVEIRGRITDANALVAEIAEVNRQVIAARHGPPPNDLLDRRDRLVSELAALVGVAVQDHEDGSVRIDVAGTGVYLVDGIEMATLAGTYQAATDSVDLSVGGVGVVARTGALAAALEARNSAAGPLKPVRADLDSLAREVIGEVNRLHASGAGLTGHTQLTSTRTVTLASTLAGAGLPYVPVDGSLAIAVHDAAGGWLSTITVPVTAATTTVGDLITAINAAGAGVTASLTADGHLELAAAAGRTFAVAGDTSDTLAALGLNTFFAGSSALDMALDPLIAADAGAIAGARVDGTGLVHPGDGTNALALARLRAALAMRGGTETFTAFYGTLLSGIGAQGRDTREAAERQQSVVQVVEGLQQQAAGVSTDEELISLTQSQHAYAAAARYVTTVDQLLQTLLGMAR